MDENEKLAKLALELQNSRLTKLIGEGADADIVCKFYGTFECRIHSEGKCDCAHCPITKLMLCKLYGLEELLQDDVENNI